ncbi:MAG TPA: hypothetical protein VGG72_21425 [Bryobacteraceae bacterium]|jgi:hypothetical protein
MLSGTMSFRDPDAIAERFNKYADAITALALLETVAFVLGLSNDDLYHAVLHNQLIVSGVFALGFCVSECLVLFCYRGEDELLGNARDLPSPAGRWIMLSRVAHLVVILLASLLQVMATWYVYFHPYA